MAERPEEILEPVIAALDAGDVKEANAAIARIEGRIREDRPGEALYPVMGCVWNRFVSLLQRRGYFITPPGELAASLAEIRSMGEGFDLYDLSRALGRCDEAASTSRPVLACRFFPLLLSFAAGRSRSGSSTESTLES